MRAGTFLLAVAWFAGSAYAGYRLTERSFAWIGDASAPAAVVTKEETIVIDVETLKGSTPEELREMAATLSPQQILCLRASISSDRVTAVLSGDITPEEEAAARKCLE